MESDKDEARKGENDNAMCDAIAAEDAARMRRLLSRFAQYSPLEQSIALARAKVIYERLYPEAKWGGNRWHREREHVAAFSTYVAKSHRIDARTVRRAARRAAVLHPALVMRVRRSWLATRGNYLDLLGSLPREKQADVADVLLSAPQAPAKAAVLALIKERQAKRKPRANLQG